MTATPAARVEARGATINDILQAGIKIAAPAFEATQQGEVWTTPDGAMLAASLATPATPSHIDDRAFRHTNDAEISEWVAEVDVWTCTPPADQPEPPADRSWVTTEFITDRPAPPHRPEPLPNPRVRG